MSRFNLLPWVVLWVVALVLRAMVPAIAGNGDCGQPKSTGPKPNTSDCLFVLRAAVGGAECSPECICDTDGNGQVGTTDALRCLRVSVGGSLGLLDCDCPTTTTTTMPPQCADIAGNWTGGGTGKYKCTIDGEDDSGSIAGFGTGFVTQNNCTASFSVSDEVFGVEIFFQGPVTFTTYNFSGEWFPEDDYDADCSQNYVTGHGVINASETRIDYTVSAAMNCTANGISFSCTASATERWTR